MAIDTTSGGSTRRTSYLRPLPTSGQEASGPVDYDPELADDQMLLRRYDTSQPVGADQAGQALERQSKRANRILEEMDPNSLSGDDREQLLQIAEKGYSEDIGWGPMDILDKLDRLGGLVRLGVTDAFGGDEKAGTEIEAGDYWNLLMGRKETLREDLGEEVVGKDARVSGDRVLENVFGVEQAESTPGKILRGIADFGLEVLLDPLTYAAGVGVGRKALTTTGEAATRSFVRKALPRSADEAVEELSPWLQRIRQETHDEARDIFRRKLDDEFEEGAAKALQKLDPADRFRRMEEALEEAQIKIEDDLVDRIGKALGNKDFKSLPNEFIEEVLADPNTPNYLTGGLRAVLPRALGGQGIKGGQVIPGTRGLGKSIADNSYRRLNKIWEGTPIEQTFKKVRDSLAGESALLNAAKGGYLGQFTRPINRAKEIINELGIKQTTSTLGASAHAIHKAAKEAGVENVEEVMTQLADYIQRGRLSAGRLNLFEDAKLDEAATEFVKGTIATLKDVWGLYKVYDPAMGKIENYLPHIATKDFRKAIQLLSDAGAELPSGTPGADLLREYIADFGRRRARGEGVVGEFAQAQSRQIGRMAIVPAVEDSQFLFINRDLIDTSFLSIDQMNQEVGAAIRQALEANGLKMKLGDDFRVLDDDPLNLLTNYFKGAEAALEQRILVHEWKKVGLIRPQERVTDVQRTIANVASAYVKGDPDRGVKPIVDELQERVESIWKQAENISRELWGDTKPAMEAIDLGQGVKVNVPKGVVETSADLRRRIDAAKRRVGKLRDRLDEVVGQRRAAAKQIEAAGVDADLANELAMAQPDEVDDLLSAIWDAAVEDVAAQANIVDEVLVRELPREGASLADAARAAHDEAAVLTENLKEARRQLRNDWNRKFKGKLIEVEEGTTAERALSDEEVGQLARMMQERVSGERMKPIVDTFRRQGFSDEVIEKAEAAWLEGTDEAFGALMDAARSELEFKAASRAKQWVSELFEYAREMGFEGLPSARTLRGRVIPGFRAGEAPDTFWVSSFDSEWFQGNSIKRAVGAIESFFDGLDDPMDIIQSNKGLRDAFAALTEGASGRTPEEVAQILLDDYFLELGSARIATFERIAARDMDTLTSALGAIDSKMPQLLRSMTLPAERVHLGTRTGLQTYFFQAVERLGLDPAAFRITPEGRVVATVGDSKAQLSKFPSRQEILNEVHEAGFENVGEAMQNLDRLPTRIRRALEAEEVPLHMQAFEAMKDYAADARAAKRRGVQAERSLEVVEAAEDAWQRKILPHLQDVFEGKRTATSLRKLLIDWDAADGSKAMTDLARILKEGMPAVEYDRLIHMVTKLEAMDNLRVNRTLLAANDSLIEGRMFRPLEDQLESVTRLGEDLRELQATAEFEDIAAELNVIGEFYDILFGEVFPRAARDAGELMAGRVPDRIFADKLDEMILEKARRIAKRLGVDDEPLKGEKVVNPRQGYRPASEVGVGGPILEGQEAREAINIFLENMAANVQAAYTPQGMETLKHGVRAAVEQWWKGSATVARPTFHIRNLVGGVFNNQIVDVGPREYAFVGPWAGKFLKSIRKHKSIDDALAEVPERLRPHFKAMVDEGVFEGAFARREFRQVMAARNFSANPFDSEFALFQGGAVAMESLEGFMRASVFVRYYDPNNPATARIAREMVNMVHFDYNDLTQMERWVKQFVPFFVWTRRNIPLQMRTLLERPGIAMRYPHLTHAVEDQWQSETAADGYPVSEWYDGYAAETGVVLGENTPFWARLLFDPDVPIKDILELNPLSGESWMNFITSSLGPQFTTPFQLQEQTEYGDVNAPTGMNEILKGLHAVGLYDDVSMTGDAQIPYWFRTLFETGVPYYREYEGIAGPSDPRRSQRLGGEDANVLDRLGLTLAKGVGVQAQVPGDTLARTYSAQETMNEIEGKLRIQGEAPPSDEEDRALIESLLANLDES